MRASNYTPVDAVKKLHEELDKLFAGKTFSGQGKNKPLNIFDFEFPTDFGNDEDVDTVAAAAPFILVKAAGWSIDKMEEPEMVDMSLIICTYQTPIRNKEEGVRDKKLPPFWICTTSCRILDSISASTTSLAIISTCCFPLTAQFNRTIQARITSLRCRWMLLVRA